MSDQTWALPEVAFEETGSAEILAVIMVDLFENEQSVEDSKKEIQRRRSEVGDSKSEGGRRREEFFTSDLRLPSSALANVRTIDRPYILYCPAVRGGSHKPG